MEKWKHLIENHCNRAFPKIRIRNTTLKSSKADQLINQRNSLLKGRHNLNQNDLENINVKIASTIINKAKAISAKLWFSFSWPWFDLG